MTVAEKVPWMELALSAEEDHFLQRVACRPGFPARLTFKPATWRAGEVVEYRNANRQNASKPRHD